VLLVTLFEVKDESMQLCVGVLISAWIQIMEPYEFCLQSVARHHFICTFGLLCNIR